LKLEYSLIDSLIELAESCEFLGLGFEWILSTAALQLHNINIVFWHRVTFKKSGMSVKYEYLMLSL